MLRTTFAAVLLLLSACGPDDSEPSNEEARSNVTGSYPVTFTMTSVDDPSEEIPATLRISGDGASADALRVTLTIVSCDLRGTMTGERTFSISPGTCEMAPVEEACSVTIHIESGTGEKPSADAPIALTLQGTSIVTCDGEAPTQVPLVLDVKGRP